MQTIKDRYEFNPAQDQLGRGGFARVFKAHDKLLKRDVVLKIAESSHLPEKYSLIEEIRRVIDFNHTHLARFFDAIVMDSKNQFGEPITYQIGVMEYVSGGSLRDFLDKNPRPSESEIRQIIEGVIKGLGYLHQRGIIHRDIKPNNILLQFDGDQIITKICDFGISKAVGSEATNLSNVIGTFEYMSPEQLGKDPSGKIGTNADFWSLGIVLYEMFHGKLPFGSRRSGNTDAQIIGQILSHEIPQEKLAAIPEPFRSIVQTCLIRDPRSRARTAEDLLTSLVGSPVQGAVSPDLPNLAEIASPTADPEDMPTQAFFTEEQAPVSLSPQATDRPAPPPAKNPKDERAWEKVTQLGTVGAYQAYLKKYPQGAYVDQAQARLTELTQKKTSPKKQPRREKREKKPIAWKKHALWVLPLGVAIPLGIWAYLAFTALTPDKVRNTLNATGVQLYDQSVYESGDLIAVEGLVKNRDDETELRNALRSSHGLEQISWKVEVASPPELQLDLDGEFLKVILSGGKAPYRVKFQGGDIDEELSGFDRDTEKSFTWTTWTQELGTYTVRVVDDMGLEVESQVELKPYEGFIGRVSDPQGNSYRTVYLNGFTWLAENLQYNNSGSKCDDPNNCDLTGRMYTWDAAQDACKALGSDWVQFSHKEWEAMVAHIGGNNAAYQRLVSGGSSSFNGTKGFFYWTRSYQEGDKGMGWYVGFSGGEIVEGFDNANKYAYCRCIKE